MPRCARAKLGQYYVLTPEHSLGKGGGFSMPSHRKARVFISCGQRRDTDEVEVARRIREAFLDAGFDPYVAAKEQTLRGVKENIFRQLASSEYFVFVDFKRERV